jgi:Mn2+/Fe2+ NRAMP family transporter
MAGFTNLRVPLLVRRAITMLPALAILAAGTNATSALVLSQVVLSFGIPFALVPLVVLTSKTRVMGSHVNRRATTICACGCVAVIIALNALVVFQQLAAVLAVLMWLVAAFAEVVAWWLPAPRSDERDCREVGTVSRCIPRQ